MQEPTAVAVRADSKPPTELSSVVDRFIESWVCWREACEDVRSAYQWWAACEGSQRGLAFDSHRTALDREQDAARTHSLWQSGSVLSSAERT